MKVVIYNAKEKRRFINCYGKKKKDIKRHAISTEYAKTALVHGWLKSYNQPLSILL